MIALNENLRVLLVVDVFPPSICGIGDYSARLAQALVAQGVEVHVLTKAVPGLPEQENVDGVEVQRLAHGWSWGDASPVVRAADRLGPGAVVHLQYPSLTNYHRRPMINLLPFLFRVVRRRHPLVVTMHGFHEHRLRWRMRVLPMLWANSALVFVHPRDQALAARWAPLTARRSTLIPIASNVQALTHDNERNRRVRTEMGIAPDKRVAIFFGEVRPDKGLDALLDAAEDMHRRGLPVEAVVVSTIGTHAQGANEYEQKILDRLSEGSQCRLGSAGSRRNFAAGRGSLAGGRCSGFPLHAGRCGKSRQSDGGGPESRAGSDHTRNFYACQLRTRLRRGDSPCRRLPCIRSATGRTFVF